MFSSYQSVPSLFIKNKVGCLTNPNHLLKKSLSPGPTGLMVSPWTIRRVTGVPSRRPKSLRWKTPHPPVSCWFGVTGPGKKEVTLEMWGVTIQQKVSDFKWFHNLLAWSDIHCLRNKRSKIHVFNEHMRYFYLITKRLFNIKHPKTS